MKRGRKPKYVHILRAMRPGDVLYLVDQTTHLDHHICRAIGRNGGSASTHNFIAVGQDPASAHRVVRVTMHKALK